MLAIDNILGMLPDRMGNGKNTQIFTTSNIAKDMIDLLPEDVFNKNSKFLDICCKSGIFLHKVYLRLMQSKSMITDFEDENDRREYIIHNQLYGLSPDSMCQLIATRTAYGRLIDNSHIITLEDYSKTMRDKDQQSLNEILQKEFETMQFDVVIGNPPYNKGMDLDFVDLGYKLSKQYVVMITPAKWQTADNDQRVDSKNLDYEIFRSKIVPHMSHVCFYPDCYDVFAISLPDGISWYIIDKRKESGPCRVENRCIAQNVLNSVMDRDIIHTPTLHNVGSEIVEYLGEYNKIRFNSSHSKEFSVNINKQLTVGGGGFSTREQDEEGHWHVRRDIVGNGSMLFSKSENNLTVIGNPKIIRKGTEFTSSSTNIFSSDSIDECRSFLSYINCKLIRFLIFINISSQSCIGNENTWKFVPAPPSDKFDHLYTDQELYQAFRLPQKYIDIIEAVIKERK